MSNLSKNRRTIVAYAFMGLFLWPPPGVSQSPKCDLALKRVVGVQYPWFARIAFLQGAVELVATISRDGGIAEIRTASGPEPLAKPAREALSKWQFTGCNSRPAECEATFLFRFVLDGSCGASENCPTSFEVDLPGEIRVTSKGIRAIVS